MAQMLEEEEQTAIWVGGSRIPPQDGILISPCYNAKNKNRSIDQTDQLKATGNKAITTILLN